MVSCFISLARFLNALTFYMPTLLNTAPYLCIHSTGHGNTFQVFAMAAGEWLCVYDIRIPNKPMVKESTHAGDATSVDWHPTQKYTIATGGGRDRSVKGLYAVTFG